MKELVALADLLDKKGFHKEADLVDSLIREAADAAGIAQSLALALEGVAKSLQAIANPHEGPRINDFVKQLVGAKDKFENEAAKLNALVEKSSSSNKLTKTAIITKEMLERVQEAAKPVAAKAEALLKALKNIKVPQKTDLEKIRQAFEPIKAVIEKIQRASGA